MRLLLTFQLRDLGLYNFLPIYGEYQINGRFNLEFLIKIINVPLVDAWLLVPKMYDAIIRKEEAFTIACFCIQ